MKGHKRQLNGHTYKTIKGHIRPQMVIQDHVKLQKATHGREMRQEKMKQ